MNHMQYLQCYSESSTNAFENIILHTVGIHTRLETVRIFFDIFCSFSVDRKLIFALILLRLDKKHSNTNYETKVVLLIGFVVTVYLQHFCESLYCKLFLLRTALRTRVNVFAKFHKTPRPKRSGVYLPILVSVYHILYKFNMIASSASTIFS
jgi:hypothetical protein